MTTSQPASGLRAVLQTGLPSSAMSLGLVAMGAVDVAMVAALGKGPLAAMALANVYSGTTIVLIGNVLAPVAVMVARARGAGETERVASLFRNSLAMAVLLAIPAVLLLMLPELVLRALAGSDVSDATIAEAVRYTRAFAVGVPAAFMFNAVANFVEGHRFMWTPVWILLGANVVNVVGDLGLIYGRWGLPALGSTGSAWVTTIVRWASFAAMIGCVAGRQILRDAAQLPRLFEIERERLREFLRVGLPLGVRTGARQIFYALLTAIIARFGTSSLAANQIAYSLFLVANVLHAGFQSGVSIVIAGHIGKQELAQARTTLKLATIIGVVIAALTTVTVWVFADSIASHYSADPDIVTAASAFLVACAVTHVVAAITFAMVGATMATLETAYMARISVPLQFAVGLPLAWLFATQLHLGAASAWYGPAISEAVVSVLLLRRFLARTQLVAVSSAK